MTTTASRSNRENNVDLPGWGREDWVKPGSCLAKFCGLEAHKCGVLDCVKTLAKQRKQLTILFGKIVTKAKTETELIADCHGGTEVNLVTALGFYSIFGSLESLLNLERKYEIVTAIRVEVFPEVLQTEQKYFGKWRESKKVEIIIRQIPSWLDHRADVQNPIPSTLCSCGYNEYEDNRRSSLLRAKMCKTCEIVGEILRAAHRDVCRKSRKNQGRVGTDTRKGANTS